MQIYIVMQIVFKVARAIPLPLSPIAASGPRRELPPLLSPPPMSKIAAAREIRPAGAPQPAPAPRLQQRGAPAAHGVVQQHCTGGSGGGEGGGGCAGGDGGGSVYSRVLLHFFFLLFIAIVFYYIDPNLFVIFSGFINNLLLI